MRITKTVTTDENHKVGATLILNSIPCLILHVSEIDSTKQKLSLMIHGLGQVRLPFAHSSADPVRVGLDAQNNISLSELSPIVGVLRPCAEDEEGNIIPKQIGELHSIFWFGASH